MSIITTLASIVRDAGSNTIDARQNILNFPELTFDQKSHSYTWNGKPLAGATKTTKRWVPPFDKDAISAKCAKKEKKTQEEILAEWEKKANDSMNRGSCVHAHIQDILANLDSPFIPPMSDLQEIGAFEQCWESMQRNFGAQIIATELPIGSPTIGLAGTVDAIVELNFQQLKCWCIFDWKTGSKFQSANKYGKLLPPFDFADDCELHRYSIQTSIYRMILEEKAPDIPWGDSFLIHLRADGTYLPYRARDYTEHLAQYLKSFPPETWEGEDEQTIFNQQGD